MTNFEKIKQMSVDEMAVLFCDNADCDVCPAYDSQYCKLINLPEMSIAMKKYLEIEVE